MTMHTGFFSVLQAIRARGKIREGARPDLWECSCPCKNNHANGDRNPSARVWIDGDRLRCWCARGCRFEEWVQALGTPKSWWFAKGAVALEKPKAPVITARHTYEDREGRPLFEIVRTNHGASFARRRVGGLWCYGLGAGSYAFQDDVYRPCPAGTKGAKEFPPCPLTLFQLPKLFDANPLEPVLIVSAEEQVLALQRAGFTATCNPGGVGHWKPEYGRLFAGRRVVVIQDNVDVNMKHAAYVIGNCACEGVSAIKMVAVKDLGFAEGKSPSSPRNISRIKDLILDREGWYVSY